MAPDPEPTAAKLELPALGWWGLAKLAILTLAVLASACSTDASSAEPRVPSADASQESIHILGETQLPKSGADQDTTIQEQVAPEQVRSSAGGPLRGLARPLTPHIGTNETIAGGVDRSALQTDSQGSVVMQLTPAPLQERMLASLELLPPPPNDGRFRSTIATLDGDPLERSTWTEDCPVEVDELAYLTLSFIGFDGKPHTGEMIVHVDFADQVVSVFEKLFDARFPIEEMRIVEPADLEPPSDGDVNNTTSFVCRRVTGGYRFSEHAYGLAIDINPFQNPYIRGDGVIPPLAMAYAQREWERPGMLSEGDTAVSSFDLIGWTWGGRWQSLKDYQHFSHNGR